MQKASFSLEKYSFDKVLIDFTLNNSKELEINFSPAGVFERQESSSIYKLTFVFTAKNKNALKPFVEIECNSIFRFANNISFEEIPSYFYANSIAIIFPYVRAFISTITLQSNYSPIVLPTMNLSSLEEPLKTHTVDKT